ncbi:MAG: response regulator transcription factor [Deltaproteobacteria bacterium]|nr:response regulator transcription factor [Deltaproteobacteria bacterium]
MTGRVRVILADDHTVLRVGLRAFLSEQSDPEIDVVADCASAEEAAELVDKHHPDLLLLDLNMPGLGGIGGVLEIRRRGSKVAILIVSQYAEPESVRRALEAGANGYIVKTARGEELVSAIRAVMNGGTYVDPTLAGALIRPARNDSTPDSDDEALARLTARERQVLRLIAEGYSNKEIAQALDIAVKTAMAHRANLMEKLNIHNRSMLTRFAIRMGVATDT